VPAERIELPTFGLQNRCSTAELSRLRLACLTAKTLTINARIGSISTSVDEFSQFLPRPAARGVADVQDDEFVRSRVHRIEDRIVESVGTLTVAIGIRAIVATMLV
jgi:hypothetical protein